MTLLLCNFYFNGFITFAQPNSRLLASSSKSPPNTGVKLENLVNDILLHIFNHLDFDDLIYMSATNSKFNRIAEAVFLQRYADYELRIISSAKFGQRPKFYVSEGLEKFIEIPEAEWIEDVFKYVGKWIHKLKIESDNMFNVTKLIDELITYTSESLVELDLNYIDWDTFESFTMPLNALEELRFSVDETVPSASMLPLNQLFPLLRRLFVSIYVDLDYNLLDVHFERLEHLEAVINYYDAKEQQIQNFECLLRKNPQIRSISLQNYPRDYVTRLNRLLPNLENLTLYEFGDLKEAVHFENVKHFRILETAPSTLEKLTFSRLESIDMEFNDDDFAEWLTFFKNLRNLSKLSIHGAMEITQLLEITSELLNLVELEIDTDGYMYVSAEAVIQIVHTLEHLVQFSFPAESFEEFASIKMIRNLIGNEWRIEQLDDRCYLERIN